MFDVKQNTLAVQSVGQHLQKVGVYKINLYIRCGLIRYNCHFILPVKPYRSKCFFFFLRCCSFLLRFLTVCCDVTKSAYIPVVPQKLSRFCWSNDENLALINVKSFLKHSSLPRGYFQCGLTGGQSGLKRAMLKILKNT